MGRRTAFRTCPLCEATCGLQLTLDDDHIVGVRGDDADVFSRGYLCPKGATFGELDHDPDRLDRPLVRRHGQLVEVGWDEAFDEVADRLGALTAAHGPDALGVYLGNPNVHNLSGQLYVRPLLKALRTRNVTSASSVDQQPKHLSAAWMFGDPFTIPVPDIDRTDLLVILGGNPRVSNGSLWTAPDLPGRLTALRDRGGQLVVVDPARTRTAARADSHLTIRPGTDALLLAAIITEVRSRDRITLPEHLTAHVEGLDQALDTLAAFTPETVADACGLPMEAIRNLATALIEADAACVYGRLGTTTQRFGTVTSWLVDLLNLVTGNLDVAGGAMLPKPAHHRRPRTGFRTGRWASRVRGIDEVLGELPASILAEEMTTPGDGQIRGLLTIAGNPVLSTPDGDALDAAMSQLELVVCVDPYVTATSRHADVILPPPPARQRSHYDLAFTGFAVRNVANYSPPVVPLEPDRPDEWEILLHLAAIALGQRPPIDVDTADAFVLQQVVSGLVTDATARLATRDPDAIVAALGERRGPDRLLDLLLRAGPYGDGFGLDPDGLTLARLEATPHGIDLGALTSQFPDRLSTPSGRIVCANEPLLTEVVRLRQDLDAGTEDGHHTGLRLIGRRHLRTNNSWSHNVASLDRGRELCTLQMHPDDASARNLADGMLACVRNDTGAVTVPIEVTDDLRPGVVSLPHGFGHDLPGIRQRVATSRPGVNSNRLSPAGAIDALSGTAVLNGIDVEVLPADAATAE